MKDNTTKQAIDKFKSGCLSAKNEEGIKMACRDFMNEIGHASGFPIFGSAEVPSIHGGRLDSIYNDVYFEFKDLGLFKGGTGKGVNDALYGRDETDHGLFHYLINFALDNCHNDIEAFKNRLFREVGVGFDGQTFYFCRFKASNTTTCIYDEKKTKRFPKKFPKDLEVEFEVNGPFTFEEGIKRVLLYVRSTQKKMLNATYLCSAFSPSSDITKKTVPYLYELLEKSIKTNHRVETLYNEWHRIFGTIYNEEKSDFVKHVSAIKKMYDISATATDIDVIKALFIIQTYYSIIVKLIVQNLFASLRLPTMKSHPLSGRSDVIGLFYGTRDDFNEYVDNFYELNYFEWFTLEKTFDVSYLNDIIAEIEQFETTASVIKPEVVSDVLKSTYESLMPKELRHLMGEYYTPEWLVDFTIDKTGYACGENESVIDPTCGSCVFITHLIKRYTKKYRDAMSYTSLIDHIVDNFVGFDINPIAVIQSKCNYILSIGDITQLEHPVSIPVYMCDSILVPTVHAKQKDGDKTVKIDTWVGSFTIPLMDDRKKNDLFLKTMSNCVLQQYKTFEDFEEKLRVDTGIVLDGDAVVITKKLYDQLLELDLAGYDGFWPVLLKNSFAPLFCRKRFDYVMGNPPWIAWKAMSESYRNLTLDIWLSYGIFEKNAYDKITSHDDFAMAVTYVSIDHYLREDGIAGLILPQTFVKSLKGGEGFRKFCITRDGKNEPFAIDSVYDMLKVAPFRGIASNKTSVYIFHKGKQMAYPMDSYYECDATKTITPLDSYEDALQRLTFVKQSAAPINDNLRSPWITMEAKALKKMKLYFGDSKYSARKGIEPCGAKGVYLVNVTGKRGPRVKIENIVDRSRREDVLALGVHPGYVEPDLVYPMLGGRNFEKWGVKDFLYMVVPHESSGSAIYHGIDDSVLKRRYSYTYKWLFYFHDALLDSRIKSAKFFDEKQFPWYRLDNVGEYTFKPYKVLWKEQSKGLECCVVSTIKGEFIPDKLVVVDSKVLYVSFDSEDEANYLCAVLNSGDIESIIKSYTINTNKGIDIVNNIRIPLFDETDENHKKLAELSKKAHDAYRIKDTKAMRKAEKEIDKLVPKVFKADKI